MKTKNQKQPQEPTPQTNEENASAIAQEAAEARAGFNSAEFKRLSTAVETLVAERDKLRAELKAAQAGENADLSTTDHLTTDRAALASIAGSDPATFSKASFELAVTLLKPISSLLGEARRLTPDDDTVSAFNMTRQLLVRLSETLTRRTDWRDAGGIDAVRKKEVVANSGTRADKR